MMAACDPRNGRYLAVVAIFRNRACLWKKSTSKCLTFRTEISSYFAEWIRNNCKTVICDIPTLGLEIPRHTVHGAMFRRIFLSIINWVIILSLTSLKSNQNMNKNIYFNHVHPLLATIHRIGIWWSAWSCSLELPATMCVRHVCMSVVNVG